MRNEQYNDTGASYLSGDLENQLGEVDGSANVAVSDTSARQGMSRGKKVGLIAGAGALALAGALTVGGYVFCKAMGEFGLGLAEKVYIEVPNSISD